MPSEDRVAYIEKHIQDFASILLKEFKISLHNASNCKQLMEAMQYAVLNGGKRMRPFILHMMHKMLSNDGVNVMIACQAIELAHCYSLVHDDIIDNDDIRRGLPSCHKKFGIPMAILTGNAILTMCFTLITSDQYDIADSQKLLLLASIGEFTGRNQMISGQAMELNFDGTESIDQIEHMHSMKTGSMFRLACKMATIISSSNTEIQSYADMYGHHIGLLLQKIDDFIDNGNVDTTLKYQDIYNICQQQITQMEYAINQMKNLQNLPDQSACRILIDMPHYIIHAMLSESSNKLHKELK